MVIYLCRKNRLFFKILTIIVLFIFVIESSYAFSYLKYNNKDIVELNTLKEENRILKEEIKNNELLDGLDHDYVIARVILRDIHNFYNEIVINVGSDKINVGDAVVNEEGLVGIVGEVQENISYVKLLNSRYSLSVKVGNTYGNLKGNTVDLLDKYSEISDGDLIYTSGLTGIPKDIYVGKVNRIKMDNNNLGKELEVTLVDISDLIYVGVISSIK